MNVKFCSPVIPNMKRVEYYLKDSFTKGHLSNFGPAYLKLEERLRDFFNLDGLHDVLLTSSGHTALMTAYATLGVKKILIPAYTFEATRVAATLQGIEVIIGDVSHKNGCLDYVPFPHDFDAVVIVAPLSTIPDLKRISEWCAHYNKKLIIDGAATFGTPDIYNYADAYCMSFHATKTFSMGEGGAVILRNQYYFDAKSYINFGFDENRRPIRPGINAKLSDYSCAVGLALLEQMPEVLEARRLNRDIYRAYLDDYILTTWSEDTIYQTLPIYVPYADRIRAALTKEGVETQRYYRPLVEMEVASGLYTHNISLPVHQDVTAEEVERICNIVLDNIKEWQ